MVDSHGSNQGSGFDNPQVSESCFEFLMIGALATITSNIPEIDSESGAELALQKLEKMGYSTGFRFLERCAQWRVLPSDQLEIIKFLCKDFWTEVFKKQVDKLQTDHRGTYVLKDLGFRWLARHAADDTPESRLMLTRLLQFPCGLIRGALDNLGIQSIVRAEFVDESNSITLPCVSFTIRSKPSSGSGATVYR